MKKKLLDLSEKIDAFTVEVFDVIIDIADALDVPFFVVGARARDWILELGYGIRIIRRTEDVDLGVRVPDWKSYAQLQEGLIATEKFIPDKKEAQRLLYKGRFPVDIIPFGDIAEPDERVLWPPDEAFEMSTEGFKEAHQNSITIKVRTKPLLEIQAVSLAGLASLKIISWNDNPVRGDRDAKDLLLLMRNYLDAGNAERLYNEEADLIEKEDFDYDLASARLLGRDIATILLPKTRHTILKILNRETGGVQSHYRLVYNMLERGADSSEFEKSLHLLEEMKAGILEKL
jgi:predicted nucleotidyltransferase